MTRSWGFWRVIATLVMTVLGIFAVVQLWQRYMLTPWTRDGRVVANSVTIASEVSGRIVDIRVRENQLVKKGDILSSSTSPLIRLPWIAPKLQLPPIAPR
jgi:multidrug resistance efflux pump